MFKKIIQPISYWNVLSCTRSCTLAFCPYSAGLIPIPEPFVLITLSSFLYQRYLSVFRCPIPALKQFALIKLSSFLYFRYLSEIWQLFYCPHSWYSNNLSLFYCPRPCSKHKIFKTELSCPCKNKD